MTAPDGKKPTEDLWIYRMDMPEDLKHFSKTKPITDEHMEVVKAWWNNRIEITEEGNEKVRSIKSLMDATIEEVKEKCPKIYSKELVETLFENPYCKGEFIEKAAGVERKAAARYLHQLNDAGILDCQKIGLTNIYINTKLMELLKA